VDRKEKKAIRLRITQLLDSNNPNYEEIQRLSKLLGKVEEKEKPILLKVHDEEKNVTEDKIGIHTRVYKISPEKYLELKFEGKTRSEIAKYYNMTTNELVSEVKSLKHFGLLPKDSGLRGKNLVNRLPKERYYHLKEEGYTEVEICRIYKVSHQTLIDYKKKHGIELDMRGRPSKRDIVSRDEYLEYKSQGLALWQISKLLKVSRNTLWNLRKEWGLLDG
jgi:DNA-binding CsgD family transcriptional regulator